MEWNEWNCSKSTARNWVRDFLYEFFNQQPVFEKRKLNARPQKINDETTQEILQEFSCDSHQSLTKLANKLEPDISPKHFRKIFILEHLWNASDPQAFLRYYWKCIVSITHVEEK